MKQGLRVRAGEEGFTLIELLVSLALLALMATYALGSLQSMRSVEQVSRDFERRAEIDAVIRNFEQLVADSRIVFAQNAGDAPRIVFTGEPDRLRLLTVLNDRLERGGLHLLDFTRDEASNRFVLRRRLFRPADSETAEFRITPLLDRIASIRFSYCRGPCGARSGEWTDSWALTDQLPSRLQLEIGYQIDEARPPRTITVPLMAAD